MNRLLVVGSVACLVLAACAEDARTPAGPASATSVAAGLSAARAGAAAPADLVTASFGGASLTFWPYTTDDFVTAKDPVNLLFVGNADPRTIRAALVGLSGDRTAYGLPDAFPFNCTWYDVPDGGIQATYADGAWLGGAIQLGCGSYDPLRFHVRLIRAGAWTVGAVHFEFLVPGTTEHKILSWEAAEQLIALDMYRTGIAAPAAVTPAGPSPSMRVLEGFLVGLLPDELKAVMCPPGVPWTCDGSMDVPVLTDGNATIIYMWGGAAGNTGVTIRNSTVQFNQVIPKPVCATSPYDYLYVSGPISFREQWVLTPSGTYVATFHAQGRLTVVPVNPLTGEPTGTPYEARVSERHRMQITDHVTRAASGMMQVALPPSAPYAFALTVRFDVGSNGVTAHDVSLSCGS